MSDEELQKGEILIYQTENRHTKVDVFLEDGTVWLSQASIAKLYQTTPQNIIMHTKNIYNDSELDEAATCKSYLQVQNEGKRAVRRSVKFYNLEMILAVGYGMTAAELIVSRADADKKNMGLTAYHGNIVRQGDVTIAKNYLDRDELDDLNRIVTMFLDHAEDMARRHTPMYMKDWELTLDEFLTFRRRNTLKGKGKVSNADMERLALAEYAKFNTRRLKMPAAEEDTLNDIGVTKTL